MNFDDLYDDLLEVVSPYGIRIDGSVESEQFFKSVVSGFSGTPENLLEYVARNCPSWFRALGDRPNWIQEAEWPFLGGTPMVFLGELEIPAERGLFHDDAKVFVFHSPQTGVTKSIIQVA